MKRVNGVRCVVTLLSLAALYALAPATANAQVVKTALLPDTINVGDIITAAIRLALLIAAALAYWWWRRRNRVIELIPFIPARPARDVALERLDAAQASGMIESGRMKEFYSEVSEALREYVAAVDPFMGTDLTTS